MCLKNGQKCWSSRWYKISLWSAKIENTSLGQGRSSHQSCNIKVESLLNKVAGLKMLYNASVFLWILRKFKNTYFEDYPTYGCFWPGTQTELVSSFSKNVFYPNQAFLRLYFSLFSLRGFDEAF